MQVFITGTDTNIGKTLVSSWLCLHTKYDYFKPVQTGACEDRDSEIISILSGSKVHKEIYHYKAPLFPHLAASLENEEIDINKITLPSSQNLIIEGAGGLLVPLNKDHMMIDLIKHLSLPVILVASSNIGTINHTLLSLEALKARNIKTLGVILSGPPNQENREAIEFYGKTKVLAQIPFLNNLNKHTLSEIALSPDLQQLFGNLL